MADLERSPLNLDFDFEHYKQIHEYLFDGLHEWAGEIRTVDISKKGTSFTPAKDMKKVAESCFGRLKKQKFFKSLDFDDFVNNIVDFYCDTNMLHPFGEGNAMYQHCDREYEHCTISLGYSATNGSYNGSCRLSID